jgi:predicted amidohydrolase YtcJ
MPLGKCPRVIVGGTLIDGTGASPVEEAIIIVDDKWITSVGKREDIQIPPNAEIIDATGKTILPGFIDAHTHFLRMGIKMIRTIDLSGTNTIFEAITKIREKITETGESKWILGRGWDDSKWEDRRFITRFDIDPVSEKNPVMLTRICGHLVTLNSNALKLAGITRDTPDPQGGKIDRTLEGEITGILKDANHLVQPFIPPVSEDVALEGLKKACDNALELGCTSIHDAGLDGFEIKVYQKALKKGLLKTRIYMMWRSSNKDSIEELGLLTGFGNDMIRLGPAKMLLDGSLGAHTAALFGAYNDESTTKGLLIIPEEDLRDEIKQIHMLGSQLAVHAIGDYAIEVAINAIDEALRSSPKKDHRHRIEHCEILSSNQIERIKTLNIIPSMQPNFVGEWSGPNGLYETRLGPTRLRQNNPYRLLLDEGIRVAFGSDGMPFNPVYGIWSAVNHHIKPSRITLEEAVKGYTLDAAFSSFEEDLKGSLEPGKLADITILNKDLSKIPPEEFKDATVFMTIVGGKILYFRS